MVAELVRLDLKFATETVRPIKVPDIVTDEQAMFLSDICSTGHIAV